MRPGKYDVCVGIHPVCPKTVFARSLFDALSEKRTGIRNTASDPFRFEGAVDVIDIAGCISTCKLWVEDHHHATVYDETNSGREVSGKAERKVVQSAEEKLSRQSHDIKSWQRRRYSGRRWHAE